MGLLEESKAQAEALAGKGYDLCKHGKYKQALELYRQACNLDGENYKYWYNAAVACDRIGDTMGMEQACLKTIECDGTFLKGYVRLAKAHLRQEKLEEASEVIATGMLIADNGSPELKALKKQVDQKQEEKSMVAARQLASQMQPRTAEEPPAMRQSSGSIHSSSSSGISYASVSASAVTAEGGNTRPHSSPVSQKPNHVNLLAHRQRLSNTGGIPANQRDTPVLNNPQYGEVSPKPRPKREIPTLNQNFGDSNGYRQGMPQPRVPRLAVPAAPNRDNGPEFKDQCKTFIVSEAAIQQVEEAKPKATTKPKPETKPKPFRFFRKANEQLEM